MFKYGKSKEYVDVHYKSCITAKCFKSFLQFQFNLSANSLVIAVISKFEKRTNSELIFLNIAVIDVVGGIDAIVAFIILLAKRTFFDFYFIGNSITFKKSCKTKESAEVYLAKITSPEPE